MTDWGLWPQEADAVLTSMSADPAQKALSDVFSDTWEGYPKEFRAVAWGCTRMEALKYIDANKPRQLARGMFQRASCDNAEEKFVERTDMQYIRALSDASLKLNEAIADAARAGLRVRLSLVDRLMPSGSMCPRADLYPAVGMAVERTTLLQEIMPV